MSYIEDAMRTKSSQFHTNTPALQDLAKVAMVAKYMGTLSDNVKRTVFYGKDYVDPDKVMEAYPNIDHKFTFKEPDLIDADMVHGILGIFTEACELMELLAEFAINGTPIDRAKLINELGDVSWYHALATNSVGGTLDEVHSKNIAKLRARFPDKFSTEAALNRDEGKENRAMESAA